MTLGAFAVLSLPALAQASSHREAPFVTKSPKVDATDFYMFDTYDPAEIASGNVVIIADYLPLQDAYGGPNYFMMDPDAMYEINVDNVGGCTATTSFQFQFKNTLASSGAGLSLKIGPPDAGVTVPDPLINIGDVATSANLNVSETYTVNMVVGSTKTPINVHGSATSTTFTKPTDNIGVKSFPGGYAAYASQYVYTIDIPGCAGKTGKMFVGQRAEPFAVNLGPTFDLIDAPAAIVTGASAAGCPNAGGHTYDCVPNPLAAKNVTSIELEIPASCLTAGSGTVLGGWTSAYLHQGRVLNPTPTYTVPAAEGGPWVEVSRLGNPLVNEVVIGLPDKDKWNGSAPKDDVANFANYVEYPTLPELISILFGGGAEIAPQVFPRTDIVAAFLTGLTGVNKLGSGTCDELRLNTALPATPAGSTYDCSVDNGTGGSTGQCYLGAALCAVNGTVNPAAAGCDLGGFPNGRRPGDDVVDIALDVMMGFLLPATASNPLYNGTVTPLTDGVWQNAGQFGTSFPFLQTPTQGANGNGT